MTRALVVALTFSLGLAVAAPARAEESWEALEAQGQKELDAGHAEAAETKLQAAVKAAEAFGESDARLARSRAHLGEALVARGKTLEAGPLLEKALAVLEPLGGNEDVAAALLALGGVRQREGRYADAVKLFRSALKIREAREKVSLKVADALDELAGALRLVPSTVEAEAVARRAVTVRGALPQDTGVSLNILAQILNETRHYDEAEKLFRRSLALAEKAWGPECRSVATRCNNLASLLDDLGRSEESVPLYRRAIAIGEKLDGPDATSFCPALNNLGLVLYGKKEYAEAEKLHRRALASYEKAEGPGSASVGITTLHLGRLAAAQKHADEAQPLFEKALAIFEKVSGPEHPSVAAVLEPLGKLVYERRDFARARALYERALAIREKARGKSDETLVSPLLWIAGASEELKDVVAAERALRRALEIREKADPSSPGVADVLGRLAALLRRQKKDAEAAPLEERAKTIRTPAPRK